VQGKVFLIQGAAQMAPEWVSGCGEMAWVLPEHTLKTAWGLHWNAQGTLVYLGRSATPRQCPDNRLTILRAFPYNLTPITVGTGSGTCTRASPYFRLVNNIISRQF